MTTRTLWADGLMAGSVKRGTPTLVQSTYDAIREDILSGKLEPGTKLRADELKTVYGVGASTLRESLNLLVGEALVASEGQRGFRVTPMTEEDFEDIVRVRKLVETQALRESIAHGDDEWEANLVSVFYKLTKVEQRIAQDPTGLSGQWEECNRAFHAALIAACPSRWLHYFISILFHQSERYRRISLALSQGPEGFKKRDVHAEHEAIYEAALSRDADTACQLIENHIDRTLNYLTAEGVFEHLKTMN